MKMNLLIDPSFVESLKHLSNQQLPVTLAQKVGELITQAAEKQKEFFEMRAAILEKYAEKDEDGNPVLDTDDKGLSVYRLSEDNKKQVIQDVQGLAAQEIEMGTLSLKELTEAGATLSGAQINALKDVLAE